MHYGRAAIRLIDRFWPGPLTLVLRKTNVVPAIVTAGLSTVAVRMPDHPVALELIRVAGVPIAAPSANRFGRLSPTTAEHVRDQMGSRIDLILDGGCCSIGVESTVLDMAGKIPILLRPGGLPLEEIEAVVGEVRVCDGKSNHPRSPGQLDHHYAPHTPLMILGDEAPDPSRFQRVGLLAFRAPRTDVAADRVEILSREGDLREAAANLFSALHRLDQEGLDIIYAEAVPEIGLGRAIANRLRKASTTFPPSGCNQRG